jgi:hypothetical protein
MPPIYSVVSFYEFSFGLFARSADKNETSHTVVLLTKQEMDVADFKGLVSDQWHVGVVGTSDLAKVILYCCICLQ